MAKEYTIAQATKDAMEMIPYGTDFHGYDYITACRNLLRLNGSVAKPYDATLLRYLRHYRELYGISIKNMKKSIYHKDDKQGELGL